MNESATVRIFLVMGSPTSIRTAEISNWTGKAVAGPRSQIDDVLKRDEAGKPGVYFLSGIDPESGKSNVYIGEAEVIRKRIKDHLGKDYWTSITFFVSKDENLTKAHIRYLEGKLIERAKSTGRARLENNASSGSHLPESDTADMDIFLSRMEQLMPILGQDFLKPVTHGPALDKEASMLICEIKGLRATGRQTENGFVVLKGSEAVLRERPSSLKYKYGSNLRESLIKESILIQSGDRFVFKQDHEFSSPSAAAAVVHGGHANGLIAWKDSKGVTIKQLEQQELGDT